MEQDMNIAKQLSDLIIYFRSVQFVSGKYGNFKEMSSISETKFDKLISSPSNLKQLLKFCRSQFIRVYPKGTRVESSNYDPLKMWLAGCQLVALNCQTGDRFTQLNRSMFRQNGGCGYILKPDCMLNDEYDFNDRRTLQNVKHLALNINVIGGRHLFKCQRGLITPFVEVEVVGADYDCDKFKTAFNYGNGFNPFWNEGEVFDVNFPQLAFLRFTVNFVDMFGEASFFGQASYPVMCLRSGYRSVILKNKDSEEMDMASLLVHIEINCDENDTIYSTIQELKDRHRQFKKKIDEMDQQMDKVTLTHYRTQLKTIEDQITFINERRFTYITQS